MGEFTSSLPGINISDRDPSCKSKLRRNPINLHQERSLKIEERYK